MLGKWLPQYEKQIAGLTGTMKYQAEQNWQATLENYAKLNPIWGTTFQPGSNFTEKEAQRGDLINQMRALLASPDAPKTKIASDARVLLQAYDAYQNQIKVGTQDGFVGQSRSVVIDAEWKNNLYSTVRCPPRSHQHCDGPLPVAAHDRRNGSAEHSWSGVKAPGTLYS